jgi:hypothetical protein
MLSRKMRAPAGSPWTNFSRVFIVRSGKWTTPQLWEIAVGILNLAHNARA